MSRPHGYARYRLDACRCYVCGLACSRYNENRRKRMAAGTWQPWADTEPVRTHLAVLSEAGIGTRRVAELTGVGRTAINAILTGRRGNPPGTRCRTETAAAILALKPEPAAAAPGAIIDGFGTGRRVQALCCLGWTLTEQATRIGWTIGNFQGLTRCRPVVARTAMLVAVLYENMSMTQAPDGLGATRARAMAAERGWVPPLAWDDDAIDDPTALPATATRATLLRHWLNNYEALAKQDMARPQIAAKLGLTRIQLNQRLRDCRLNGLVEAGAA